MDRYPCSHYAVVRMKLYDRNGREVPRGAVRQYLPDHEFERLSRACLIDAENMILRCAVHDALGALDRDEVDVARRALERVEADGMKFRVRKLESASVA